MNIRLWFLIHKWTSLVCTVFLLMLCLTGLPLIFHEEIDHTFGDEVEAPEMPAGTPAASMDQIAEAARLRHPGELIRFAFWDEKEHPHLTLLTMTETYDAPPEDDRLIVLDSRTADILDEPPPDSGFMYIMFKLHVDLFAGLPGMLFLGFMGLLFVVAIVSGVVLYSPFMRKLDFGTVRTQRSTRLQWLDLHNLLGVVTLVWALVVGLTGSINTLSQVVIGIWQQGQLAEMVAPYKDLDPPTDLGSVQRAMDTASAAVPDMDISFLAWPGTLFSSPHHYSVFMRGTTPLTSRLLQPALIDAVSGELTDTRTMPWYVQTLLLSQPLHFGDYGGLPLKVLWLVLDLITIVVLGSGLYLWIGRHQRSTARQIEEIKGGGLLEGETR
ncbi:PepSY domain-containing protein [Ketobacter sp. MCCC 1A13808]|uniref:PepSY-associated TM helix domain-containing protein n=1 Tax=Ketobacter sp. MCCC 1A13808 TaxID=2602738 RepID=UPI000F2BB979|nr:PepSY domain-containing protein [Ketobacter sp. MCCC 1A13808]MVF13373.1 PepSY domain-containing protein [Ketobacter sp. MCCC 1A13808]RLP54352.1 MAG: PepSY domain-containing protein [Ketobacter sp.]